MKIGTKSILFGVHQFILHPIFVSIAWWKLYGFPFDLRLWVAFFVHDLGYWGKPNMDGKEGEKHVELGARIMGWLFDRNTIMLNFIRTKWVKSECKLYYPNYNVKHFFIIKSTYSKWFKFCLFHSRYYAKKTGNKPSKLCVADKYSIYLTPYWLYIPLARLTGEIHEYMAKCKQRVDAGELKYTSIKISTKDYKSWYKGVQDYLYEWVMEHKDGKIDNWTPDKKEVINE